MVDLLLTLALAVDSSHVVIKFFFFIVIFGKFFRGFSLEVIVRSSWIALEKVDSRYLLATGFTLAHSKDCGVQTPK